MNIVMTLHVDLTLSVVKEFIDTFLSNIMITKVLPQCNIKHTENRHGNI